MKVAGLTPVKSIIVSPPRVKESAMNMECKVRSRRECSSTHATIEVVVVVVAPNFFGGSSLEQLYTLYKKNTCFENRY